MIKKSLIKVLITVLVTVFVFVPFTASASFVKDAGLLSGIGMDFLNFMGKQGVTTYDSFESEELVNVETTENSAVIVLENSYMNLTAEQYNILLNSWSPIQFEHTGYSVKFSNLQDSTFYKVRINYLGKSIGEYSFFTKPKSVENLSLKFDESSQSVNLKWDNPKGFVTEIFKKNQNDLMWNYIGLSRTNTYVDKNIPDGSRLCYKLRFVCKNSEAISFSESSEIAMETG